MNLSFIVIDDSELDCFIAEKLIRHKSKNSIIKTYTEARAALKFIQEDQNRGELTVILLDILMPVMDGVKFAKELKKLPEEIQQKYAVIAFTSSLNKLEIEAISNFDSVIGIITKPVRINDLIDILTANNISWRSEDQP